MRNNVVLRFNIGANGENGSRQRVRIVGKRILTGCWDSHTATPNANPAWLPTTNLDLRRAAHGESPSSVPSTVRTLSHV
jgi:hypothetical protein